jgi:hypothetical protein
MPQVRREWRIQRVAWPLLYALLAACLLGLFGQGPLSHSTARSADGRLRMDFDRFLRQQSDDDIEFVLLPAGPQARLRVSSGWLRRIDIDNLFPEPEHRISGADAVTLEFAAQAGQPMHLRLNLRAKTMGGIDGWVALDDGPPLHFHQFVYP